RGTHACADERRRDAPGGGRRCHAGDRGNGRAERVEHRVQRRLEESADVRLELFGDAAALLGLLDQLRAPLLLGLPLRADERAEKLSRVLERLRRPVAGAGQVREHLPAADDALPEGECRVRGATEEARAFVARRLRLRSEERVVALGQIVEERHRLLQDEAAAARFLLRAANLLAERGDAPADVGLLLGRRVLRLLPEPLLLL